MPDSSTRRRLAAQNGAVRALVQAESQEQAVRDLLREVCTNLGWRVGEFWVPSADQATIHVDAAWPEPHDESHDDVATFLDAGRSKAFHRGEGLPGRVWGSGAPAWITDVAQEPNFPRRDAALAAGIRSAFGVPVPLGKHREGVLEFFSARQLDPDQELLETMAAVGGYLGEFYQRRTAESALQASEERFRTFGSTVPDATFIIDETSRIVYVNDAVRRIFGYSPSELIGSPLTRLMSERHRPHHMEMMRQFTETGERTVSWDGVEMEGLRRDGTEVPLEVTYGTFERDGRRFFTGIARDVSEPRRAEERLRFQARLLDAVGEAVIATDMDGRIIYWNAFAEQLYGWSADEVLGHEVSLVTPTAAIREHSRELMRRLASGEQWSGEFLVRDRSGREFPVLVSDSPIRDEQGRLIGIVGTSIEITERKRREDGQRFLAEASRVLASSLDYATTLRTVATLAVPDLGDWCLVHLRAGDGQSVEPVARVVPEGDESAADALEQLLINGDGLVDAVLGGDSALIGPSDDGPEPLREGRLRAIGVRSILTVPLRAHGTALGVITFAKPRTGAPYDATDASIAEELGRRAGLAIDNARLYREAEEGNRAKADFLAVVSHELRTPLNAIAGYADLLAGEIAGELNSLQARHVDRIKVGATHLAHLIDEVLTYARVETGRDRLQLETANVGEVAREAVVVIEPDATDKGLDLDLQLPDQEVVLHTDAGKVRQILVNLLSNAVKYTEEGQVRVEIRSVQGGVEMDVSDTGIGIPPEATERIFEPFWQAESPNTRTVGGTGLGLSVSRRLARLLEGDIQVASEIGVGSTFTVRIPDHPDHSDAAAGENGPEGKAGGPEGAAGTETPEGAAGAGGPDEGG
jgi:PAS domain S-box-containing protein